MKRLSLSIFFACLITATSGCAQDATSDSNSQPASGGVSAADLNPDATSFATTGPTSEVIPGRLRVGNPAPQLVFSRTVHGDPIEKFEKGKVHVVEFWATWCGPCIRGMPHISKLAEEYKDDVNFMGVTRESAAVVKQFLNSKQSPGKTWSQVIKYSLVLDDNERTSENYMAASGQEGIPAAFIVGRDGIVDWIGHPMEMDKTLEQVVDGTFDRQAVIVGIEAADKIDRALRDGDIPAAIKVTDDLAEKFPDDMRWPMVKMQILNSDDRIADINRLQAELAENRWDNANHLELIAWTIAADKLGDDFDLALKCARRASELTDDQDSSKLETVARVYFEQNDIADGVKWQRKAVEYAEDEDNKAYLTQALEHFEKVLSEQ